MLRAVSSESQRRYAKLLSSMNKALRSFGDVRVVSMTRVSSESDIYGSLVSEVPQ